MTAQSIVCGTCAAAVPYGRLSCPSCGELLASVAGARRAAGRTNGRRAIATATAAADPPENGPATVETVTATIPAAQEFDPAPDAPAGATPRLQEWLKQPGGGGVVRGDDRSDKRAGSGNRRKGKRARYYRITTKGRKQLAAEQSKWDAFVRAMGLLLKPADEDA